jgi:hypothetical protein
MEQTSSAPIPPYASEILLRLQTPGCPEDRLMLAVVLDAVAVLRECATGVYPHVSRLVTSTARWFTSADESWPMSFVNVCRTLGLDPMMLREGLRGELADLGAPALLDDPPAANKVVPFTPAVDMPLGGASSVRRRTRG